MRVLLVTRNFFPAGVRGGAQVSVKQVALGLMELGHDVAVLNVDDHEHIGVHESGIPEYRLKLRNVYTQKAGGKLQKALWHFTDRFTNLMEGRYREVIRDFRPDVINTHVMAGIGIGLWKAAAAEKVPVVHRVSDYYLTCINSGYRRGDENCAVACQNCRMLALRNAQTVTPIVSHIIYVSERIKELYDRNAVFPASTPFSIIPGAYRAGSFRHESNFVDGQRLTLGFFGRIAPEKGLDGLLSTLERLEGVEWSMLVGGPGDKAYIDGLKARFGHLPVDFIGVQNPDDFYSRIDALVVSSLWEEPSGRVAFESGLHGVVPIVTNRGGLPEMVGHGSRGLVFDPEQPDTLIEAVTKVARDHDFRRQVKAAWIAGTPDFDPQVVAQKTYDIYQSVIAGYQA
jgi:Glycosyltransferase